MNRITWSAFFAFLSFIVIAYYLAVIILYYRKALKLSLLNKIFRLPLALVKTSTEDVTVTETIYASITQLIQQAAKDGYPKEEILFALHKLLHTGDNIQLNELSYRTEINRHITDACQQYCSIHLSEEDLRVLWI